MFPTLFLLTSSMTTPTPFQVLVAQTARPSGNPRLPDLNGPDAIFRKYKIEPIPMGDPRLHADQLAEMKIKVEQLQKQIEEHRQK